MSEITTSTPGAAGPPKDRPGRPFTITIDGTEYSTSAHELTGAEILALAGKTPATHRLIKVTGRNQDEIAPDEIVKINSGLKFVTVSTEPTPVA